MNKWQTWGCVFKHLIQSKPLFKLKFKNSFVNGGGMKCQKTNVENSLGF